jgi:hypothetical protein
MLATRLCGAPAENPFRTLIEQNDFLGVVGADDGVVSNAENAIELRRRKIHILHGRKAGLVNQALRRIVILTSLSSEKAKIKNPASEDVSAYRIVSCGQTGFHLLLPCAVTQKPMHFVKLKSYLNPVTQHIAD